MPGGAVIANQFGLKFQKGFLYTTLYNADGTARTADLVTHGALNEISVNYSRTNSEIGGPESLSPLGVGIQSESLTFNARWGVLTPANLASYLGGSISISGGNTVYSKGVNDEPNPFDLHLKNPLDGSVFEMRLYRCLIENMPIIEGGQNRTFILTGISGRAYGQGAANSDKLFDFTMAGNWNNSS